MNIDKLNFKQQNLKLDFIILSAQKFYDTQKISNLANYFHEFGFNCFVSQGNFRKIVQTFYQKILTKDTLILRINYWNQTVFEFTGQSANKLYELLKLQQIDWSYLKLKSLRLSIIDICYDQQKSLFFHCKAYSDDPEPYRQKWDLGEVEFRISILTLF